MAEYAFAPAALARYEELERNQDRWPVLDRIDAVVESLAEAPGSEEFRRHRWQDPTAFAVAVPHGDDTWMVLWELIDDSRAYENLAAGDVHILYVGPWPGD